MKEFNKSIKLEHVAYDIRGPVLEEAMRMRANGEKILRLNTGNPAEFGFTAPDEVIHDLIMNARDSEGYSDSKGIFSARKAIMQYCQLKKFPNVDIDDIYLGNGVSELIVMSMQGLLDNGDEVLVPMPDYPLWTAAVSLAGGNAVHYVCDEEAEWYPDLDDIKSKISSNTKAIVLINPNNPTGALYPKELLLDIIEIARQNDLIIFADEIYDRMVMDGNVHTPVASLAPDLFCVSMNGLSKSHRIAGFIYNAIQDIPGLSAVKPKAGLYIFPKIDRNMYRIDDDEQFVLNFLKQEKVLLVHGRGFNWKEPDHFRIVYLPRVDELAQIQEKMTRFLKQYRR